MWYLVGWMLRPIAGAIASSWIHRSLSSAHESLSHERPPRLRHDDPHAFLLVLDLPPYIAEALQRPAERLTVVWTDEEFGMYGRVSRSVRQHGDATSEEREALECLLERGLIRAKLVQNN